MMRRNRRLVTGLDDEGASCVADDAPLVSEAATRISVTNIWSAGPAPVDNQLTLGAGLKPFTPAQMGAREHGFMLIEFAPGYGREDPSMHATDTLDQFYVAEGSIILVLDREEVMLFEGDVGVLRGLRHGWRNETGERALLVTSTIPALPPGQ